VTQEIDCDLDSEGRLFNLRNQITKYLWSSKLAHVNKHMSSVFIEEILYAYWFHLQADVYVVLRFSIAGTLKNYVMLVTQKTDCDLDSEGSLSACWHCEWNTYVL
jgi:hypothetical protein